MNWKSRLTMSKKNMLTMNRNGLVLYRSRLTVSRMKKKTMSRSRLTVYEWKQVDYE
jgi:hypothetical protein